MQKTGYLTLQVPLGDKSDLTDGTSTELIRAALHDAICRLEADPHAFRFDLRAEPPPEHFVLRDFSGEEMYFARSRTWVLAEHFAGRRAELLFSRQQAMHIDPAPGSCWVREHLNDHPPVPGHMFQGHTCSPGLFSIDLRPWLIRVGAEQLSQLKADPATDALTIVPLSAVYDEAGRPDDPALARYVLEHPEFGKSGHGIRTSLLAVTGWLQSWRPELVEALPAATAHPDLEM